MGTTCTCAVAPCAEINNAFLVATLAEPVLVSIPVFIIPVLSKYMKEEGMSGPNQQFPMRAVMMAPITTDPRGVEMKDYKRGYFSVVVAMILARARRECDSTDDITAAVANFHISDQPAAPANQKNPFF